jgi:2-oxoglutarate ferredoxin oxidoreductase subunit alpha
VFIASNKEIGMTRESIILQDLHIPDYPGQHEIHKDHSGLSFNSKKGQLAPPVNPMRKGGQLSRLTSSTHDPDGYITADPKRIEDRIERLQNKLTQATADLCFFDIDEDENSDLLIIAYGVTARAAKDALSILRGNGLKVSLLILKTLYPVAEETISSALQEKESVLVIEMNCGQYLLEIQRIAVNIKVHFLGRMNGELITPNEIVEALQP